MKTEQECPEYEMTLNGLQQTKHSRLSSCRMAHALVLLCFCSLGVCEEMRYEPKSPCMPLLCVFDTPGNPGTGWRIKHDKRVRLLDKDEPLSQYETVISVCWGMK